MTSSRSHDLRAALRFKNGLLFKSLNEFLGPGWSNKQAGAYLGVSAQTFSDLIRLKIAPKTSKNVRWRVPVSKISERLGYSPEELFPESLYALNLPGCIVREFESPELLSLQEASTMRLLPSVDFELAMARKLQDDDRAVTLASTLATLSPSEEKILKMRFGLQDWSEHTLEEVGQYFAVPGSRIRQIEAKALRKLRHPARRRLLDKYSHT